MVKGGETYQLVGDQHPSDHDARPRCIFNPSENACGILAYIQQYIFQDLKDRFSGQPVVPEFIHGMNTTDLKERVEFLLRRENLEDVRSISMDGSAFDSNQNRFVQERVDCEFVRQYSPRLLQILERCSVELQWNCDFT